MTKREEKEETPELDAFRESYKSLESHLDLQKQRAKDPRPGAKDKARKALYEGAHNYLVKTGQIPDSTPLNAPEFMRIAEDTINNLARIKEEDSDRVLFGNLDAILEQTPSGKLENLVLTKPVQAVIGAKDADIVNKYAAYKGAKDFLKQYVEGGAVSPDQRKQIVEIASEGAYEQRLKDYQKAGYSTDLSISLASVSAAAVRAFGRDEDIKKYAEAGLKKYVEDAEKAYKAVSVKRGASDVARDAIKKLAKGSVEEAEQVPSLVYSALSHK